LRLDPCRPVIVQVKAGETSVNVSWTEHSPHVDSALPPCINVANCFYVEYRRSEGPHAVF